MGLIGFISIKVIYIYTGCIYIYLYVGCVYIYIGLGGV